MEKKELYKHQQVAFERYKDANEICLFFEMGCGKTATALKIVEYKFNEKQIDGLLIIAPNGVHTQWANEQIPQWLDCEYQLQCLYGRGGRKTVYEFQDDDRLQIVCVNVDTFSTAKKWKEIVEWSNTRKLGIILDEATVIKNPKATRTQHLLYEFNTIKKKGKVIVSSIPKTVFRVILTGTPVTNGALDLWSLMEFVRPNFFGRNWYSFKNYYGMFTQLTANNHVVNIALTEDTWKAIKGIFDYSFAAIKFGVSLDTFNVIHSQDEYQGPYKHADELKERIKEVGMFVQLKDCVDMPEQNYIERCLSMTTELAAVYNSMAKQFIAQYKGHNVSALNKMSMLLRLQQISSGFVYDKDFEFNEDEEYDVSPDKIQWIGKTNSKLEALYNDVNESIFPIIIVTRFSAEAARIYDDLKNNYKCCLITGWKRVGTIEGFKKGEYQIMVANSTVISKGHNLQIAHTIMFYSNTFSLETRDQTEGRIWRLGQKQKCNYIDYRYVDSIDDKIIKSLRLKKNILNYIMETDVEDLICLN